MSPPSGKYIIRCRNELVDPNVHEPSFPGKATKVYHGTHGISPVWNLQLMPDKRYVLSNVGGQARDIHGLLYTQVLGPDATMHWDLVPMERAGPHMYQ
ncbi:hypothetical protein AMATHDRAFT_66551 [Amanita thiersii Skay4041]|uniref:Ricin B lectin domain-containing protein n=1 Tax=Amanita thiersii Skay4041 TaxID=703135 RepID=A0A2A9NJS6_9AGAR|nr:hypothetical protein AMATHDRAFT_66551 [Amanita thiersii Skay4041]